jgi:hypothetical protein
VVECMTRGMMSSCNKQQELKQAQAQAELFNEQVGMSMDEQALADDHDICSPNWLHLTCPLLSTIAT